LYYHGLRLLENTRVEVKMTMRGQTVSRMRVLLLFVCCLVPLAALAAVLYVRVPVWLVAPAGLLALVLLARRLLALLAADDRPDSSHDVPAQRRLMATGTANSERIKWG
jgi:hypothetical protein